ncbi:hypothetical protein AGABI2DRAFT_195316 [Agaricus bisporus var. bisporus H97]|uniref:hypothetical protein n=1 Tax=Agaricus bisporus var. bisporus (strain H97 / ATCC MYA-4626 / FGSC 10389) TaxID=936046 RepID=UPI00029F5C1C|nr:hypothetical protein AGABI2DRAFT_195316 [Agaricus bisporus var. bisporus H97]EKV43060.1 hypothetical protein AGABI2DRAFT_195316 [Agaricus bisporus var. bisporus H97]
MSARPLSDEEVSSEMNKMTAFIQQEAQEKGREIRIKADEEFAIEKAKLVRQEQQAIDAQYEKKRKGVEVAQKIAQSTLINKSRLRLLHRREEHLQDLFSEARSQLTKLAASDPAAYSQFLQGVIVQGFLQIMESSIIIRTRPPDHQTAEQAAQQAAEVYHELTGLSTSFEIEPDLPEDGAGGVLLSNASRRIKVDNSLDERLRLLEDRMLPEIRRDLFGINQNRKFYT